MEPTLFRQCNIMYIDHLAVTTLDIGKTLADYLGMPGARLVRGPALNPLENVLYAFVQLSEGLVIEILGVREGSPVSRHVSQGGGPYHFCFAGVSEYQGNVFEAAHGMTRSLQIEGRAIITQPISSSNKPI